MGRHRLTDKHLPPRLRRKHRVYYYVAGQRWIRLSDNYAEAVRKWADLENTHQPGSTVGHAIDRYLIEVLPAKSPDTRRSYLGYLKEIRRVFGDSSLAGVDSSHVAQYLDRRSSKVAANREIAVLSGVYHAAMRWGWCKQNPCYGVRRNSEAKRKRYVTDAELAELRATAGEQLRCVIDLVLITALRRRDVLSIRLADLQADGLHVQIRKTKGQLIFAWTPGLQEVIERARRLRRRIGSLWLFATHAGQPYTMDGFATIWTRLVHRSEVEGLTFHDLRARALTDAKKIGGRDYAQALAAHQSGDTTERYIRGREVQVVKPIK